LLYTLAGLERPEAGSVTFEGKQFYQGRESEQTRLRNERIGFVFQAYFLLAELTALENVMMPMMIHGKAQTDPAQALLERVGLADRMNHLPAELSGGEQQRVAIARALINDPSIIFADEPTGNLDSKTGQTIVELLLTLVREKNKTLVVVTHDASLASRGERRLEIRDGMLAA
jgi:predicted ABC-type transport system involved in lysophospholipase L1 biosynthesis ATPase subunit